MAQPRLQGEEIPRLVYQFEDSESLVAYQTGKEGNGPWETQSGAQKEEDFRLAVFLVRDAASWQIGYSKPSGALGGAGNCPPRNF